MNNWLEEHKGLVFTILVVATLVGGGVVYLRQPAPPPLTLAPAETTETVSPPATSNVTTPETGPTETPLPQPTPTATPLPPPLRIYVTGQVKAPDVYLLPAGSIIKDALDAAGGPTSQADLVPVNLAQVLVDQQQITIPAHSDSHPTPPPVSGGVAPSSVQAAGNSPQAAPESGSSPAGPVNLNTAGLDQLTQLSGIGPAIAQRIIDHRAENGPFATIEEITNVKGIGPSTFEKIKGAIIVQ